MRRAVFHITLMICLMLGLNVSAQHKAYTTAYDWKPLAEEITEGADDGMKRLELIYRWICSNIEYDTTGTIYKADNGLDNKKGVCQAYCEIFFRLAEALDIESVIITGEVKNPDNSLSDKEHTWILADSGLGWILIDPTWGAGSVMEGRFVFSKGDMSWFNVDPYIMVSSHLPFDESYQRIPEPVTRDRFLLMDWIDPALGILGLKGSTALGHALENKLSVPTMYGTVSEDMMLERLPLEGTLNVGETYRFQAHGNDRYRYEIRMDDKPIHEGCWTGTDRSSTAEFVVACEKDVIIYVLDRNAPEGEVAAAFEYKVHGDVEGWKAVQEQDPFLSPEMKTVKNINIDFMRQIGIDGKKLLEELTENSSDSVPVMYAGLEKIEIINIPMHSPLKVGQEYTFEFRCKSWRLMAIINGNTWHRNWDRAARKDGIFKMTVTITEPGPVMLAYNSDASTYNFLLEYIAVE